MRSGSRTLGLAGPLLLALGAAAAAQSTPVVSERIEVRLVEVELWATADGRPVVDLLQSELRLFADGQPADIAFFDPPASGAGPPAAVPAPEEAPLAAERGTVAVFLDDAHLAPAHRARVVGELVDWLSRLDAGVAVTVVRHDRALELVAPRNLPRDGVVAALRALPAGGSRAVQAVTDERRTLDEIRDLQRRGLQALEQAIERAERIGGEEIVATDLPCAGRMLQLAEELAAQVERTARDSLAALADYTGSLAALPGRKLMLYVSDGVPIRPGGPAFDLVRALCDGSGAIQGLPDAIDVSAQPAELRRRAGQLDRTTLALAGESRQLVNPTSAVAAQATAAGIPIWTLGARGLTPSGADASTGVRQRTGSDELRQRAELEAALSALAADTGGRALLELGDFGAGLDELAADLGSSYLLAFLAPRVADGKLRQIRLETTRPGVRLRHRRMWRDVSGELELGGLVRAALLHGIDRPGLRASAQAVRLASEGGAPRTVLRVVVPESALSLLPDAAGGRHGVLRLAIAVREAGGEPSPVRSRAFPVERPPTAAGTPPQPVVHEIELPPLAAGSAVAVGLLDEAGGDVAVLRVPVEGP